MKVDLGNIDPRAIPSARGAFYVRDTMWGTRAQAWPKKRPRASTPMMQAYRDRFGFAARMAATPFPTEYDTAVYLSQDTEQVPRDLLTQAALGRFYELYWQDGTAWPTAYGPLANTRPEKDFGMWEWSLGDSAWTGSASTSAFATKGLYFTPPFNDTIYSVRVLFTAVALATYKASVGYANASHVIQAIVSSGPQLPMGAGLQIMQFDLSAQLVANERNFITITRTDLLGTTALSIPFQTANRFHFPLIYRGFVRLASVAPIVGNTLTVASATDCPPIGFLINQ